MLDTSQFLTNPMPRSWKCPQSGLYFPMRSVALWCVFGGKLEAVCCVVATKHATCPCAWILKVPNGVCTFVCLDFWKDRIVATCNICQMLVSHSSPPLNATQTQGREQTRVLTVLPFQIWKDQSPLKRSLLTAPCRNWVSVPPADAVEIGLKAPAWPLGRFIRTNTRWMSQKKTNIVRPPE